MTARREPTFDLADAHKFFARTLHGEVWELLDQDDRGPEDDERMLLAAHGSMYHWLHAGTARHHQRAAWLLSRANATLGAADEALRWARRAEQILQEHPDDMADFDHAFLAEALARAHAASGHADDARAHRARAAALGEQIADEDDRETFFDELRREPWYGTA